MLGLLPEGLLGGSPGNSHDPAGQSEGFPRGLANVCLMRKSLLIAALGLIGLGLFANPVEAGIRREFQADAFFLLGSQNGVREAIWVWAVDMAPVLDGDGAIPGYRAFSISHGYCRGSSWDSCRITHPRIVGSLRGSDVLEFDPELESAFLKVTRHGMTHVVRWKATAPAMPFVAWMDCNPPIDGAGLSRTAKTSGTVFGHKVKSALYWGDPPAIRLIPYGPGCIP